MDLKVPGYLILEKLHESNRTLVCRAQREATGLSVILKILKPEAATLEHRAQFQHEFEINTKLQAAGIVRALSLEPLQDTLLMVMEDLGGEVLSKRVESKPLELREFLSVAIRLAGALDSIHQRRIIHKDINPTHIVWNFAQEKIGILDFGLADELPLRHVSLQPPAALAGTLEYSSPEQTGRMNRPVDYRTDFYSLGVTFYRLLTGKLPFEALDALGLVHLHIAKNATEPSRLNPAIPKVVSDIIMKLMAKMAEDRYQRASGLKLDLEKCLHELTTIRKIPDFVLGAEDYSEFFQIPQKLYGRETETGKLLGAFAHAVDGGRGLFMIQGEPGVGKTALVHEILKPITERRGYFIEGKFSPWQRNSPYYAWIQAFTGLAHYWLMESESKLAAWKQSIAGAVGPNGKVLTDVIPALEMVIGAQPAVPDLGAAEAQNRFNYVFGEFIKAVSGPEHPLVVFLDDLQWIDMASLNLLLQVLGSGDLASLLVVGAYRSGEVDALHPLHKAVESLAGGRLNMESLTLDNLTVSCVSCLVADALHRSVPDTLPLAELIFSKTAGNAFFTHQMLGTLAEAQALKLDLDHHQWHWDMAALRKMDITDNVLILMEGKVQKLPPAAQRALTLASCIGTTFDAAMLGMIAGEEAADLLAALPHGLREGLIVPEGDAFRFVHDRVQQAAYSLIPEAQRPAVHLKIGRLLLASGAAQPDENIFNPVSQINLGASLISDPEEKHKLAALNLQAGKKAKAAAAFEPAYNFFKTGLHYLDESSWRQQYELTLSLHEEAAETASFAGHGSEVETWVQGVLRHARGTLDKVKAYEARIGSYIAQEKLLDAVQAGLEVLGLLGLKLPRHPGKLRVLLTVGRTVMLRLRAWKGERVKALLNLPEMTDPVAQAKMRILEAIGSPVYLAAPELVPLVVCHGTELSVFHGNGTESPYFYAAYGLILCGALGDTDTGFRFGQLALDLLDHRQESKLKTRVAFMFNNFIRHAQEPLKETLQPLMQAYHQGLETGDYEYAARSLLNYAYHQFLVGEDLIRLDRIMESASQGIGQLHQGTPLNYNRIFHQTVSNFLGEAQDPCRLEGKHFQAAQMIPVFRGKNDQYALSTIFFTQLMLCYFFGDYAQAVQNARLVNPDAILALYYMAQFYAYDSLAHLALAAEAAPQQRRSIFARVAANQKKLQKLAHGAPMNHLHRFFLVEAELARAQGDLARAVTCFGQASALAARHGYGHEEALAYEREAEFWRAQSRWDFAQLCLNKAHQGYLRWQARGKVRMLEARYPQWLAASGEPGTLVETTPLDLTTVMKAAQAISSEIALDRLLNKMMGIVIENAGAQRGFLVMEEQGVWMVAAEGDVDKPDLKITAPVPLQEDGPLAAGVIRYVARTQERVVLDDACNAGDFVHDPNLQRNQTKSLLCAPLLNRGKLIGILYLENNLATHAFTPERIQLMENLLSQAATSLENARVYEALRISEERFRMIFDAVNDAIFIHAWPSGEILDVNERMCEMYGYTWEEAIRLSVGDLSSGEGAYTQTEALQWMARTAEGVAQIFDWQAKDKNGKFFWVEINMRKAFVAAQAVLLVTVRDISERKRAEAERAKLEDQLRQALKMESVGRLAGGVAHDFNNLLTPILGYAALLALDMPETNPQYKPLYYIKHAAERARDLTSQLLAFSRRQVLELKTVRLSGVVKAFEPILLRTIREDVKLVWRVAAEGLVRADVGQLEQVLMNLAVNAQDAMPKGGLLTIETEDLVLDEAYARQHPEVNPGPYLMLAVSDTGTGIDPKLLEHLFEPFFTTKVLGKGTGLGLSMVYGIVKQHGGSLSVYSETGKGSTFKVFLPRIADETGADAVRTGAASTDALERGSETILVVEDNSLVRDLACDMLRTLGYRVLSAESAEQGLQVAEAETGTIDLLLADVIIPGMDGKEIYNRLSVQRPGLKVLYMSGYTSDVIVHHGVLDQGVDFIPKPLSLAALSKKLRKILGTPAA